MRKITTLFLFLPPLLLAKIPQKSCPLAVLFVFPSVYESFLSETVH